jgi:hypothetical protein
MINTTMALASTGRKFIVEPPPEVSGRNIYSMIRQ